MKIYGFMPIWDEADWAEHGIKNHLQFVDKLIISEGYFGPPWHFWTNRSKDGTIDILNSFKDNPKITIIKSLVGPKMEMGRGITMKKMLSMYKKMGIQANDWIMLCDIDEFYTAEQMKEIIQVLKTTKKDYIEVNSRSFIYNFTYYYETKHVRFWRYTEGMKFYFYNQYAVYKDGTRYESHLDKKAEVLHNNPMFHYSFIRITAKELQRRTMEVKGKTRDKEIFTWIDEFYLKWNEKNAKKMYEDNKKKYGVYGFFPGYGETIKKYTGPHPKILDNHPYRHIKDIRKITVK